MRLRILSLLLLFSQLSVAQGIQRIKCSADSTQQYALYLPPGYSGEKKYPVIIFLDPVARGNFPVEKYHHLAEDHEMILVGSFNSRNFDESSSSRSFATIRKDLAEHYSIDPGLIWIAGFSGGSRAASSIAMSNPGIAGVIACGAGFTGTMTITPQNLKAYAAIAGNSDMNYSELLENSGSLDEIKVNNILLEFDGGHEWPPLDQLQLALLWMTGRKTISPGIDSLITATVRSKIDSGFLYAAWLRAKQLQKIPALKDKAGSWTDEIMKRKNFTADKISFQGSLEEELKYMNEFSLAFGQLLLQDPGAGIVKETWLRKAGEVEQMTKDKKRYRQLSGQRCYDHSTRSCLEYYYLYMENKEYSRALMVAGVLLCFNQQSSTTLYMLARAEAGSGNRNGAEKYLVKAIKKGLTLNRRIEEDALLQAVFSAEELKKMFEEK